LRAHVKFGFCRIKPFTNAFHAWRPQLPQA
jgi:hypothetical protein